MSTTKVVPIRISPTERRRRVKLGVKAGKSNRAIAKELGVDEKMIRLDRKLATPVKDRPARAAPPKGPKKKRPVYELSPEKVRELRMQTLLEVAQLWITREGLILPDIEYIVDKAGKLLYKDRLALKGIPISLRSPSELMVWGASRKDGRRCDRVGALWQVVRPLARVMSARGGRAAG